MPTNGFSWTCSCGESGVGEIAMLAHASKCEDGTITEDK